MSKVAAVSLQVRRLQEASAFYQLLGFREHHREGNVVVMRPATYLGAELILVMTEGTTPPAREKDGESGRASTRNAGGGNPDTDVVEPEEVKTTSQDVPALVLEGIWDREQLKTKGVAVFEKTFEGFPPGLCVRDPDGTLLLLRHTPDYDSYSI